MSPINELDLPALLAGGMSQELHWFPEDVPVSRLASALVGLANSQGGTVLMGVSPRAGEIIGLTDVEAASDLVFQAALLAEPVLVLPIPRRLQVTVPGGSRPRELLWVTVPKGLPHAYSLDGRYLGRDGAQTNPLPARKLRELMLSRGVVQLESRIAPDASLDDLDPIQVGGYVDRLRQAGVFPAELTPEELLYRRGCLKRVDGVLLPTHAALLLFGRYPQQWLPNATILAGRFPGWTLADVYIKQDIGGSLPEQLRQAEAFIQANIKSMVRVMGLAHREEPEYPVEAVRELLVNAIAHRDYNQQGDNIHLFMYADRLEVESPGTLPGPVTLQNLLEVRFARNVIITQVLSDLGFVERLGYGLDRVLASMSRAGLRAPQFEETAGSFRVVLHNNLEGLSSARPAYAQPQTDLSLYQGLALNPRQQAALEFLGRNLRITNHQYQELCPKVHAETLRRDLVDLVSQGILIKIGDKRATYYILKRLPEHSLEKGGDAV